MSNAAKNVITNPGTTCFIEGANENGLEQIVTVTHNEKGVFLTHGVGEQLLDYFMGVDLTEAQLLASWDNAVEQLAGEVETY